MLYLKENDPETCDFFRVGNFCVNKNDVPFCAIDVGHAMEQEIKNPISLRFCNNIIKPELIFISGLQINKKPIIHEPLSIKL